MHFTKKKKKKNLEKEHKNICSACTHLAVNTTDTTYKWGNVFS